MKILILRNNFTWSLDKKLKEVNKFFEPIGGDEYTIENTYFKEIPHQSVISVPNSLGNTITFQQVEDKWYDTNISKPARDRGFDCVIFLQEPKEFKGGPAQGYRMWNNLIIQEIVAQAKKTGSYNYCGVPLKGDQLTWILIHEILHAKYLEKNLFDNTHKYFSLATPEKCLEDFKNTRRWKYFRDEERTGSLGHTISELEPTFVDKLDILRGKCGFAFVANSGYRTVLENTQVGGAKNSAHTRRIAIDISCTDATKRIIIVGEAYIMGFTGIGVSKTYVHLEWDILKEKERDMWTYE